MTCPKTAPYLGNLAFTMDEMDYEIKPIGYLLDGTDFNETYTNICIFGIGELPGNLGSMFLLGDVFLRNYYSVYDWENESVHLAINIHAADHVEIKDRPSPAHLPYIIIMSIVWLFTSIGFFFLHYKQY